MFSNSRPDRVPNKSEKREIEKYEAKIREKNERESVEKKVEAIKDRINGITNVILDHSIHRNKKDERFKQVAMVLEEEVSGTQPPTRRAKAVIAKPTQDTAGDRPWHDPENALFTLKVLDEQEYQNPKERLKAYGLMEKALLEKKQELGKNNQKEMEILAGQIQGNVEDKVGKGGGYYLVDRKDGDWYQVELWENWPDHAADRILHLARSGESIPQAYQDLAKRCDEATCESLQYEVHDNIDENARNFEAVKWWLENGQRQPKYGSD